MENCIIMHGRVFVMSVCHIPLTYRGNNVYTRIFRFKGQFVSGFWVVFLSFLYSFFLGGGGWGLFFKYIFLNSHNCVCPSVQCEDSI